jgi:hypothetical protein
MHVILVTRFFLYLATRANTITNIKTQRKYFSYHVIQIYFKREKKKSIFCILVDRYIF